MKQPRDNIKIVEFFLKFMLTQMTIIMTFENFNRIITYLDIDFDYVNLGPYMVKTSLIPRDQECYAFYNDKLDFVELFGKSFTKSQYMQWVRNQTKNHSPLLQVSITSLALILSLTMQLLNFVIDDNVLIVLDNLFTYILPHFCLYENTINWGDLCIQQSPILNIIDFVLIGKIGSFTVACIVILLLIFLLINSSGLLSNSWVLLMYSSLVCVFGLYVFAIDIVDIYSSIYIVRVTYSLKSILMAFQLYIIYFR